ncbi:dipeptidase [Clostridium sediminicola]|uniref:dipeptidase n=1 Tax=Clostridium sediminicola TaxID=3114879 RepID=UPI0031F1D3CA
MNLIDFHCDTIYKVLKDNSNLLNNSYHVDINKLIKSNSIAQFFAMCVNLYESKDPLQDCLLMVDRFHTELEKNKDKINLATNYNEIMNNKKENKISAFLTIEEGGILKGKLENLRIFKKLGVSLITLTWNFPNEIGYPNYNWVHADKGLTPFGLELISEMNDKKMIIDVSHLSDAGFYDVARYSKSPFIASHSNAREIEPNERNLTDEMIKVLAEKGSLLGINFYGLFLNGSAESRIDDIVKHITHIKQVGGIDIISLGTDFDGINSNLELKNIGKMDLLVQALKKDHFTEKEIEKIFYKNALRFIKDVTL